MSDEYEQIGKQVGSIFDRIPKHVIWDFIQRSKNTSKPTQLKWRSPKRCMVEKLVEQNGGLTPFLQKVQGGAFHKQPAKTKATRKTLKRFENVDDGVMLSIGQLLNSNQGHHLNPYLQYWVVKPGQCMGNPLRMQSHRYREVILPGRKKRKVNRERRQIMVGREVPFINTRIKRGDPYGGSLS